MIIPIVIVVVIVVGYFVYENYQQKKKFEELGRVFNITVDELKQYNGKDNKRIFVSINGDIFDVTNSPFYSPGASYNLFAGRDATVGLAKNDLTGEWLGKPYSSMTDEERQIANDWHDRFSQKYRKVGKIIK